MLCRYWIVGVIVLIAPRIAWSQDRIMAPIPEGNEANMQIIGGKPATRADWPSTLMFDGNVGRCTSTVVGRYVVLTAGHCVDDNSSAKLLWDNQQTKVLCHVHPEYRGPACESQFIPKKLVGCTADIAICVSAKPISFNPGRFERVRSSPPPIAANDKINLLGFGCTEAAGKISDALQVGLAKVDWPALPGASSNPELTMKEFIKTAGAAVCSGDSGGASYSIDPKPEMIAVASRGNLSTESYLVDLRTPQIQKFLRKASSLTDFNLPPGSIKICGIDPDAENCR